MMIVGTESVLTAIAFSAACCNSSWLHLLLHFSFNQHLAIILIPLLADAVGSKVVLALYSVIGIDCYDRILYLLALKISQRVFWSGYGVTGTIHSGHNFTTSQVSDVPLLHATRMLRTSSTTVIDVLGRRARYLRDGQYASMNSCDSDRCLSVVSVRPSVGYDVVVVQQAVVNIPELLVKRNGWRT